MHADSFKKVLDKMHRSKSLEWLAWTPPTAIVKTLFYFGGLIVAIPIFLDSYMNLAFMAGLPLPESVRGAMAHNMAAEAEFDGLLMAPLSCFSTLCVVGVWVEIARNKRRRSDFEGTRRHGLEHV
jgi:hypothetical protein